MKFAHYCLATAMLLCGGLLADAQLVAELDFSSSKMIGKTGQPIPVPLKNWTGDKGAIVFKITPQNWSSSTNNTAVLVRATETPNTGFLLYKHGSWDLALSASEGKHRSSMVSMPRKSLWQAGQSHYIVLNWNRQKFAEIYVDGKLRASQKGVIHIPNLRKLTIGTEGSWGNSHSTLVQGYRVFSRPLTEAEIFSYSAAEQLQKKADKKAAVMPFPQVKSAPVADGRIAPDEYPGLLQGLIAEDQHAMANLPASIYTGHDKDKIYFALQMAYPDQKSIIVPDQANDSEGLAAGPDVFCLALRTADLDLKKKAFNTYVMTLYPNGKYMDCHEFVDWENPKVLRDTKRNFIANYKVLVRNNQLVIELALDKKALRLNGKQEFLVSFGTVMHKKRYLWKDHTSWFDSFDAYTLARLGNTGVQFKHPDIYKGQLDTRVTLRNAGQQAQSVTCRASVANAGMNISSDEYIDDIQLNQEVSFRTNGDHLQLAKKVALPAGASQTLSVQKTLAQPGLYLYEYTIKSGAEIVAARALPFIVNPPLDIVMEPLPSTEELSCQLVSYESGIQNSDRVQICFMQNQKVVKEFYSVWQKAAAGQILSMKNLAPGSYQVRVQLRDAQNQLKLQGEKTFVKRPLPEWLVDRKGLEAYSPDWAPAPWGKIRYNGNTAKLWAGDIQLGSQGILQQITGLWRNLLAQPVRIFYRKNGQVYPVKLNTPVWSKQCNGLGVFKQTGRAPHLRLEVTGRIEFDGFMKYNIKLIPLRKNLKVDAAWVEYTLRNITQYWASGSGFKDQLGYAANKDFYKLNYLWLGNNAAGLNWFADNQKGWVINSTKPRADLRTAGNNATVRLWLVNEPSKLTAPVDCTMGWQPTPIKRPLKNWRTVASSCMSGVRTPPINLVMAHPNCYNAMGSAHPEPRNPQIITDWLQASKKNKQTIFIYLTPYHLGIDKRLQANAPLTMPGKRMEHDLLMPENTTKYEIDQDYDYFKAEWRLIPESFFPGTRNFAPMAYCTPKSSWADYLSYKIHKVLTVYKLHGVYFDLAAPRNNGDPKRGYAYKTKDQKNEVSVEIFASRELFKRLYAVFKSVRGYDVPTVICHSYPLATPCASFWDYALTGEGLKVQKRFQFTDWMTAGNFVQEGARINCTKNPRDPYDPVGMRINFAQAIWGVPVMILAQYGYNSWGWQGNVAREMISMGLVNGSALCSNLISVDIYNEVVTRLKQQFGMDDVEFFPYWNNGIKSSAPEVKASYYKKNGSEDYLLIVSNLSGKRVKTQLTLPPALQNFRYLYDIETTYKEFYPQAGQPLELTIPGHDCRMVRFLLKK